jgi:hypothetical protein
MPKMPVAAPDAEARDKQRTEALMEIAEALKTMMADIADLRASVRAIAAKR